MAWTKQSNITPLLLLCTLVSALGRSVATQERPVPNIHPSANHGLLSLCLNRRRQGKSRQKNQFMRARAKQPFSLTRKDRLRATVFVFARVVPQGIEMRRSRSVTAVARCCQNSLPHPSEPKYLSTTSKFSVLLRSLELVICISSSPVLQLGLYCSVSCIRNVPGPLCFVPLRPFCHHQINHQTSTQLCPGETRMHTGRTHMPPSLTRMASILPTTWARTAS
jgi:hypothetical protein